MLAFLKIYLKKGGLLFLVCYLSFGSVLAALANSEIPVVKPVVISEVPGMQESKLKEYLNEVKSPDQTTLVSPTEEGVIQNQNLKSAYNQSSSTTVEEKLGSGDKADLGVDTEKKIIDVSSESKEPSGGLLNNEQKIDTNNSNLENSVSAPAPVRKLPSYQILMREINKFKKSLAKNENINEEERAKLIEQIEVFIQSEKEVLDQKGVELAKQNLYFQTLKYQLDSIDNRTKGPLEKMSKFLTDTFPLFDQTKEITNSLDEGFKMPKNPSVFKFNNDEIKLKSFQDFGIKKKELKDFRLSVRDFFGVDAARAFDMVNLPVLSDIEDDGGEIIINSEIKDIAKNLNNNPVRIYNFVRNITTYEPYFGAKKGALGCLREKVCNDTDATSLTIALMRAAGIPAHYKKSVAVISTSTLRNLLGVDETRTVYAALYTNKVPVHVLSGSVDGQTLDSYDFSQEQSLALEWTYPEIFIEYDERGGNINNETFLQSATTTDALRAMLGDTTFTKRQWLPLDVIFKNYTHTKRNILVDQAQSWNTENFWNNYLLNYTGDLSPMEKYQSDLNSLTGQTVSTTLSTLDFFVSEKDILPPRLPYRTAEGESGGVSILAENYSILPNDRRQQVTISLSRESNPNIPVLERVFYGSEINNVPLDLIYEGATEADQAIIDSYGGIHATPAALVSIKPYFQSEKEKIFGSGNFPIGEALLLKFKLTLPINSVDPILDENEKFSTAGNSEGIYLILSKLQINDNLDNDSKILLEGNTGLAYEYIRRIEEHAVRFSGSLDYTYNNVLTRVVVTQNRILNRVNGIPTSFDFKGLTIDATSQINDHSRRGNYKNHRKDFRLLWGLSASDEEAKMFRDVTGLESISSVNGLRYASENTSLYTVHTITSGTPNYVNLINSLNLSQNTKTNLINDIQTKNAKVLTPDRPVQRGEFSGILYISLLPDWTGTYAIGEQVGANGGWSFTPVSIQMYCDSTCHEEYQTQAGARTFVYHDRNAQSVTCSIDTTQFLEITNNTNVSPNAPAFERWSPDYGAPCLRETKEFGTVSHTYILTTRAAKFYSPNRYNYWTKDEVASQIIAAQVSNMDMTKFRFNPIAGTYSYNTSFAVYYEPVQPTVINNGWQENGRSWRVEDENGFLSKLAGMYYKKINGFPGGYGEIYDGKSQWILNKLGYPTSGENIAAVSKFGTHGFYQNFIGGQLYTETEWINETYYVPGYIAEEYNNPANGENYGNGQIGIGTAGRFGFPVADPVYSEAQNMVFQQFENDSRIKDFQSRPVGQRIEVTDNVTTIPIIRNYTDPQYRDDLVEGFMDGFSEGGIYGVGINIAAGVSIEVVFHQVKTHIVKKLGKEAAAKVGARFVPGVGWVLTGLTVGLAIDNNWPIMRACSNDPDIVPTIEDKSPAYYCGRLASNTALAGIGMVGSIGASNVINKLGVGTQAARLGKNKLLNAIEEEVEWKAIAKSIAENKKSRTRFFEYVNGIIDDDVKKLANDSKIFKRLFEDESFFLFNRNARDLDIFTHVMKGNVKNGVAGGFHHYPSKGSNTYIIEGTKTAQLPNGVYKAQVVIDGVTKSGFSTFFPDSWPEKKVLDSVNLAHTIILSNKTGTKIPNTANGYHAVVNEVDIRINLTNDNKIISTHPNYDL